MSIIKNALKSPIFYAVAIVGVLLLVGIGSRSDSLGVALPYQTNSTGTVVTVKNIATEVLAARSGRGWFRLGNVTSTVSCVISSSTAGMAVGAGIIIYPFGLTTSTQQTYFDSGEVGIEWSGSVSCIGSATTTMATFEK